MKFSHSHWFNYRILFHKTNFSSNMPKRTEWVGDKIQVPLTLYRQRQPLRSPEGWWTRISRQSAYEGGWACQTYAPATFTPQEIPLVVTFVRSWSHKRAKERPAYGAVSQPNAPYPTPEGSNKVHKTTTHPLWSSVYLKMEKGTCKLMRMCEVCGQRRELLLRPYTKWALLCWILIKICGRFCWVDGEVHLLSHTEVPGIESRWARYLLHLCRPTLGPCQPPPNMYRVSFPAVKRPERRVDNPTPPPLLRAWFKNIVQPYLYFSSGPSCPF